MYNLKLIPVPYLLPQYPHYTYKYSVISRESEYQQSIILECSYQMDKFIYHIYVHSCCTAYTIWIIFICCLCCLVYCNMSGASGTTNVTAIFPCAYIDWLTVWPLMLYVHMVCLWFIYLFHVVCLAMWSALLYDLLLYVVYYLMFCGYGHWILLLHLLYAV